MTAVGYEVLSTISDPSFLDDVQVRATYFVQKLQALAEQFGLSGTRGMGLLQALILNSDDAAKIVATAMARGLLINAPQPNIIRFMPALTVTHDEIDRMIEILSGVLSEVV